MINILVEEYQKIFKVNSIDDIDSSLDGVKIRALETKFKKEHYCDKVISMYYPVYSEQNEYYKNKYGENVDYVLIFWEDYYD